MFTAPNPTVRLCRRAFLAAGISLFVSGAACAGPPIAVRVGSISAIDPNLAHAVKETLITDLAKSERLTLLAGSNVPGAARASYTLTGSCLFAGPNVIINLRMVNAAGNTVPGAAENVEGPRSELFRLVHSLAGKFSARISGNSSAVVSVRHIDPIKSTSGSLAPGPREPLVLYKAPQPDNGDSGDDVSAEPAVVRDRALRDAKDEPCDRPERSQHYTSVIIDARGLGLERSMSPRIRRKDGTTVYDGAECTPDFAIETGVVGYANRMRQARDLGRAGSNPLIIEAIDRHEQPLPGDPIISDEDAEFLAKCARRDGFFKKFNVIFLIDR